MALIAIGTNKKLGDRIGSYSRPVGPSCPSDCPFLIGTVKGGIDVPEKLRCYAEKVQNRYTSVREKWSKESFGHESKKWTQWIDVLSRETVKADRKGVKAIRIHVGGDFVRADTLDRSYVAATLLAYRKARKAGARIPVWFYTHAWREIADHVRYFRMLGIETYASVHTAVDAGAAVTAGFLLAIDPGTEQPETVAPFVEVYGVRAIVCPEMRKKGRVDCTGCMYCPRGKGNVVFFRHR